MRNICVITNQDIGALDEKPTKPFRERLAARAVLIDENDNVAILEAKNIKIHKILGGGIEEGEDIELALEREIMEESGCKGEVFAEVGTIVERRANVDLKQTNYCYLMRLLGKKGVPTFTCKEIEEGFELVWVSFDEALRRFSTDCPEQYAAKFQGFRDRLILKEALKLLGKG